VLAPLFVWLESTRLAATVSGSLLLTASLSSIHLLGTTLVGGGALMSSLRLMGLIFTDRPATEVMAVAGRGIVVGLAISVTTGILLFSPRASAASQNGYFQIKMLLILAGVLFHVSLYRAVRRRHVTPALTRLTGALCAVLWIGVVLAGSAFILLE
jgi:hypothetical protein